MQTKQKYENCKNKFYFCLNDKYESKKTIQRKKKRKSVNTESKMVGGSYLEDDSTKTGTISSTSTVNCQDKITKDSSEETIFSTRNHGNGRNISREKNSAVTSTETSMQKVARKITTNKIVVKAINCNKPVNVGEKVLQRCKDCGKIYWGKHILDQHVSKMHSGSSEIKIQCN